jgi:predicted membrane channel-forming protein YqfA (hemolysin III family)
MESAGRRLRALGLLLQRVVGGGQHVIAICMTGVVECTRLYMTLIVECVLTIRCKLFFCIRRRRTVLPFVQYVFCGVQCVMCYHHFYRAHQVPEMVPILLTVLYSVPDAVVHRFFLPPALHRPPFPFHGYL